MYNAYFVMVTLNGLHSSWGSFVQEDARVLSNNSLWRHQDVEIKDLVAHAREKEEETLGKEIQEESQLQLKNKDQVISKVKRFSCHKFGHFVYQCPQRKRKGRNMHQQPLLLSLHQRR